MFVKKGKGRYVPNCYGYDKKCLSGYNTWKNITDAHLFKVAKLDTKKGVFKKKPIENGSKNGMIINIATR